MPDRVRVGIVGTSWWADWLYLPSLKNYPHADMVAICGRNRDRAEEMATKYEIPRAFTDYRAMIEQAKLDAVIISTPDDLHYEMVMCALEAGLHVLCEKPLALNAADARAMYEKANSTGLKQMTFFTYRWMPQYQYVHELVEQGILGRCFQAEFRFRGSFGRDGKYNWRFDRQRANGNLADFGSHMIDLARWYLGDITRVWAHLNTFVSRDGEDGAMHDPANDSAQLVLEFASGASAHIVVSVVARPTKGQMQQQVGLYGELGSLEADIQIDREIRVVRHAEPEAQSLVIPDRIWGEADHNDCFDVLFKNSTGARLFIDCVIEDRTASPDFYDGWRVQQVIDAALASDQSGGWVPLGAHQN